MDADPGLSAVGGLVDAALGQGRVDGAGSAWVDRQAPRRPRKAVTSSSGVSIGRPCAIGCQVSPALVVFRTLAPMAA